jgi:hypothetical protein
MSQTAPEPEPHPASVPALRQIPRRYLALGLIIVAICLLGVLVLVRDSAGPSTSSTVETLTPAPSSLLSTMASVPASVFNAIGASSPASPITPLQPTGVPSLSTWVATSGGDADGGGGDGGRAEPVVFFYGAEFAPYPAVERWPLVLALSRFGTFNQLGLMQSSPSTAFANVSTFTFWNVAYTSHYVHLEAVERYSSLDPTGAHYQRLQTPNARQAAAVSKYSSSGQSFALLDIANRYVLNGASFAPGVLAGLTQSQIAGDLSTPASPLAQAVVASANQITAAICGVDHDLPGAVCRSRGVLAADAALKITPPD